MWQAAVVALIVLLGIGALAVVAIRAYYSKQDKSRKYVLVTGAASGIGKAITLELIERGDFVIGSDISEQGLKELEQQYPASFLPLPMNVGESKSVQAAAAQLAAKGQKLDAIVNNAGIMKGGPVTEIEDSVLESSIAVNVLGTFYVIKYFFPLLRTDDAPRFRPRIINMGSEVSYVHLAAAFNVPYALSKFSVEAISQGLRQEMLMLKHSPHVVVINPGAHITGMTQRGNAHVGVVSATTKYAKQIEQGGKFAQDYMDRHGKPARGVALNVANAVHLVHPPYRMCVNVSMEMMAMKFTPQFLLDLSVTLIFGKNKE